MKKLTILSILILLAIISHSSSFCESPKYVVQLGAYSYEKNADIMYKSLLLNDYKAFKSTSKYIYVLVGPFNSKLEANITLNKLKLDGYNAYVKTYIQSNNSTSSQSSDASVSTYETNKIKSTSTESERISNVYSELDPSFKINTIGVQNTPFNNDVVFQGVFDSTALYFEVKDNWIPNDNNFIYFTYNNTNLTQNTNSSLTVYLNSIPIKSYLLSEVNKTHKLLIPAHSLKKGFNELKFGIYSRISTLPCEDNFNPANWLVIDKNSYVHIEYTSKIDTNAISDFPYPYFKNDESFPYNAKLIYPDNYISSDLSPMFTFISNIGKILKFEKKDLKFASSEDIKKNDSNFIFIGSIKTMPSSLQNYLSKDEIERAKRDALIKEIYLSSDHKYKLLLVTSSNIKSLNNAVISLTDNELVKQMKNSSIWISENQIFSSTSSKNNELITLKSLGYSSTLFEGIKKGISNFSYSIPKNWDIDENSKFILKGKISGVIDLERSAVSVFINGIPAGSVNLNTFSSNDFITEFKIPSEIINEPTYNIKIVYNLKVLDDKCDLNFRNDLWAFISNETALLLPHSEKTSYTLNNLSAPFIKDNNINNFGLVLPERINKDYIKDLTTIIQVISSNSTKTNIIPIYKSDDKIDENVIVFGTPSTTPFIKTINPELYIKYNKDFSSLIPNKNMDLLENLYNNSSTIQLISSKLINNHFALIISSLDNSNMSILSKAFSNNFFGEIITTPCVIIDQYGLLHSYSIIEEVDENELLKDKTDLEKQKAKDLDKNRLINYDEYKNFMITLTIICLITLSIILILVINRKKYKNK